MQKEEITPVEDGKKGLTLGKGKLPEEKPEQAKPTLKPPMLITPEVVFLYHTHIHTHSLFSIYTSFFMHHFLNRFCL